MVPPPKRLIKEDTPVTETAAPDQSYSLVNYSHRQGENERRKESSPEASPRELNTRKGRDIPDGNFMNERQSDSLRESPKGKSKKQKRAAFLDPDPALPSPPRREQPPMIQNKNQQVTFPSQPEVHERVDGLQANESAIELVSYSEQVIIGEMKDIAPGIPNQDEVLLHNVPQQQHHVLPQTQPNILYQ